MAREEEESGKVEWRNNGPEKLLGGFVLKLGNFLNKAWETAVSDPIKVIHCIKVGLALSLVSLVYYIRPLYKSLGENTIWAVMTVVVVFEYTVGGTLYKCINRVIATFLAGVLGLGVHWMACKAGKRFEPVVHGVSVFLLAAAATFSRFLPTVKAQFDYGVLIFILTFSMVLVSGYHVDELFDLAYQRFLVVAIGVAFCITVSMVLCPVWAGNEIHQLININLVNLADSLDGRVASYFNKENESSSKEGARKKIRSCKCVIDSKATEESMAKFARWEPGHGQFSLRHPWKHYLKIGAMMRKCAYRIEALEDCLDSQIQAPESLRLHIGHACMSLSSSSSEVLKEVAMSIKTMTKSANTEFLISEMDSAVHQLQSILTFLPEHFIAPKSGKSNFAKSEKATVPSLIGILPLITSTSLLIEIAARIREIVKAVKELARMANFKVAVDDKTKQEHQPTKRTLDKFDI